MARRCGLDAGHHVIEYAAVRFCGNENEDRWDSLNDFTHEAIPDWDSPGLIDIFDGKHGAANSHNNKNHGAEFFRDFHHRYQNIWQKYGKKAAQTWMKCFYQTKEENVHKLVDEMDKPVQIYVKKLEYSKQFPVFSPDIGSSVYGGFVESMNGADLKGAGGAGSTAARRADDCRLGCTGTRTGHRRDGELGATGAHRVQEGREVMALRSTRSTLLF